MDKFIIIACGFSLSFLGYYSFIYSLTNTPTIIVEALKKTMNPIMYKELSEQDKLTPKTKKRIYLVLLVLFLVQMTLPVIVYSVLKYLNLINKAFTGPESYAYIYILSIGFFFQGIYHFINPYYFYYKKSGQLLVIQLVCIAVYLFTLLVILGAKNYSNFMWSNSGLLVAITLLCILVRNRNVAGWRKGMASQVSIPSET
jgi:O-antigen/teichoic acid export membrane protein